MNVKGQFLVFQLEGRSFAIRLRQVIRVIRSVDCAPLPNSPKVLHGVMNMHGEMIPVFNVRERFGYLGGDIGLDDHFIVTQARSRKVALQVEAVVGVIEPDAEQIVTIEKLVSYSEHIDGAVQMEDGLVLIHDLDRFLTAAEEQAVDLAMAEHQ